MGSIAISLTRAGALRVELFDEEITTGPMIREITGKVEMDISVFEKRINELKLGEFLKVNLIDVNGTETFSNWMLKKS